MRPDVSLALMLLYGNDTLCPNYIVGQDIDMNGVKNTTHLSDYIHFDGII